MVIQILSKGQDFPYSFSDFKNVNHQPSNPLISNNKFSDLVLILVLYKYYGRSPQLPVHFERAAEIIIAFIQAIASTIILAHRDNVEQNNASIKDKLQSVIPDTLKETSEECEKVSLNFIQVGIYFYPMLEEPVLTKPGLYV